MGKKIFRVGPLITNHELLFMEKRRIGPLFVGSVRLPETHNFFQSALVVRVLPQCHLGDDRVVEPWWHILRLILSLWIAKSLELVTLPILLNK